MDDAAGEALDKGGKLLGIPYPGGAELEKRHHMEMLMPMIFLERSNRNRIMISASPD